MKLAIFLPNWIGDLVMATPALRALRRRYPSAQLVGVLRPYLADVLAGTAWLDELVFFHPKSTEPSIRTWGVVQQLRARQVDTVALFTHSLRAAAMAWLSGAKHRVGFARNGRSPLLTRRLVAPREGWRYLPTPAANLKWLWSQTAR